MESAAYEDSLSYIGHQTILTTIPVTWTLHGIPSPISSLPFLTSCLFPSGPRNEDVRMHHQSKFLPTNQYIPTERVAIYTAESYMPANGHCE